MHTCSHVGGQQPYAQPDTHSPHVRGPTNGGSCGAVSLVEVVAVSSEHFAKGSAPPVAYASATGAFFVGAGCSCAHM